MKQGMGNESLLYTQRFADSEQRVREATWQVLGPKFFQKYIRATDTVVDIGAGDGLLLRNIYAARRIALDISPHALMLRDYGIEVLQAPATDLSAHLQGGADVIVMSNFLEHLPEKRLVIEVFTECRKALRADGRVLILQPNIRYAGPSYWDYIDHHIALTEHSLEEALNVCGFKVSQMIPRFLPYSAKSGLGRLTGIIGPTALTELYLRFPIVWRFLGAQTFIEARMRR